MIVRLMPALLLLSIAGCSQEPAPVAPAPPVPETETVTPAARMHFTDVTEESGLVFTMTAGADRPEQILEVKGGGFALVDLDGDGDRDVFIPNGATLDAPSAGPGSAAFENLGDLRFQRLPDPPFRGWGMGAATGDVDGDGADEVYVTAYGTNALLGGTPLADRTAAAGVGGPVDDWSTAAAFGDLDGDGDLDLYVVNYLQFDAANPPPRSEFRGIPVLAGPRGLAPQADVVYENLGDGTFRDATEAWGFADAAPAYGLGALIVDVDDDGDLDVYVGNDSQPSYLFINDGGRFAERGQALGIATNADGSPQATMGLALTDVNGDRLPDLFSTNFASDTNTLHVSVEGRFFDDETRARGLGMVSYQSLGWACAFVDFDHDGDEDLIIFNGHVYPEASIESMNSPYLQVPLLFARNGDRFDRVEEAGTWLAEAHCDRSSVVDDLDGDGDIDVIVAERGGPLRVLRNDTVAGRWLIVEPAEWGCRVEVEVNGATQSRWVISGQGFMSASARIAHFALPPEGEVTVRVTWADGSTTDISDVAPNGICRVNPGD